MRTKGIVTSEDVATSEQDRQEGCSFGDAVTRKSARRQRTLCEKLTCSQPSRLCETGRRRCSPTDPGFKSIQRIRIAVGFPTRQGIGIPSYWLSTSSHQKLPEAFFNYRRFGSSEPRRQASKMYSREQANSQINTGSHPRTNQSNGHRSRDSCRIPREDSVRRARQELDSLFAHALPLFSKLIHVSAW